MMFLRDEELEDLLANNPDLLGGLDRETEPYTARAPIQAASVDLTIGDIFVPGKTGEQLGSISRPRTQYNLKSGGTAVVTTREICDFPSDIGAIGFPPSRVSSQGLLMTNPGHVDPGYRGRMRFTVINMAHEPYPLRQGDRIVSLLLFQLANPARSGWTERNSTNGEVPNTEIKEELLNRLSADFLDVSRRAHKAAKDEERKTRIMGLLVPLVGGILAVIVVWFVNTGPINDDITNLKERTAALAARAPDASLKKKVEILEHKLSKEQSKR
jgi:dCTP deaminase